MANNIITENMDIVCCTDNNYVIPCGVLITSICVNNPNEAITVHILTEGISDDNQHLLRSVTDKYNQKIIFHKINRAVFSNCPISRHITLATYFRLVMTDILPININKVLYLDCDIVVRNSIRSLWETDLDGYAVGVVPDMSVNDIRIYNRLKYQQALGYFNAGVLLVNLQYWRESRLSDIFFNIIDNNSEILKYHDQDVLNIALKDKKKNLNMKYNVQHGYFFKDPLIDRAYDNERKQAISDPVILHYSGSKPWFIEYEPPFKNEFAKYLNISGLDKGFISHIPIKARIKATFRNILERLGLIAPKESLF